MRIQANRRTGLIILQGLLVIVCPVVAGCASWFSWSDERVEQAPPATLAPRPVPTLKPLPPPASAPSLERTVRPAPAPTATAKPAPTPTPAPRVWSLLQTTLNAHVDLSYHPKGKPIAQRISPGETVHLLGKDDETGEWYRVLWSDSFGWIPRKSNLLSARPSGSNARAPAMRTTTGNCEGSQ